MKTTPKLRCMFLCFCLMHLLAAPPARAHETDQFTLPVGRDFADLGEYFNDWAFRAIDAGVKKVNQRIERAVAERRNSAYLAGLQSRDELVRAVNGEFPNAYDVIEGLERTSLSSDLQRQYPGKIVGYKEMFTNIYQHVHFPLDPRQLFRLWHASTFKVYGTYLGGDKIGHFTDMGMHYYRAYREAQRGGATEAAAIAAAVKKGTEGPLFSERGMVGYWSAGAYSNADLVANYMGFLFYRNLTEPVSLKGQLRPPMVVRSGEGWKLAPHVRRDSDFFAWFISDHFNEALNPSRFEAMMRSEVRKAVKNRTEIIMARYCDAHGNRHSKLYFDNLVDEFSTYYGEDYGHYGTASELVTIGNTCFEYLPPEADAMTRDSSGNTPLHLAAAAGDREAIKRWLSKGAHVNAPVRSNESYSSEWGNTPLHYAAREGHVEAIRLLLEHGANINAASDRGQTPLHRAVNHPEALAVLLQAGADVHAGDNRGQTALHWAALDGRVESIALLLDKGAAIEAQDNWGQRPLHIAARAGNLEAAATLLGRGANVNSSEATGLTPLHVAAPRTPAMVDLLLNSGADPARKDEFGWTALHEAARHGQELAVEALLNHGADVNSPDVHQNSPLHIAARFGRQAAAATLVLKGANVKAQNVLGATALHEAAFAGDSRIVEILLAQGADVFQRNRAGRTPSDIASSKRYREVIELLRNGGHVAAGMR